MRDVGLEQELDHPIAFGDPVPGRCEREEDRYDDARRLVAVRGDRMEQRMPGWKLVQVSLDPREDVVSHSRRLADACPARGMLMQRVLQLIDVAQPITPGALAFEQFSQFGQRTLCHVASSRRTVTHQ